MSVMAKASGDDMLEAWNDLKTKPEYRFLKAPETGLVMVQARAGGTGRRFNFGEMTMTKCIVELPDGTHGHGYIAGSDPQHAEIAAVLDAVLQTVDTDKAVLDGIIAPLAQRQAARLRTLETKTAATRVDFFTLVRGEDE
jgi:alpha-D-ribose 1-methylphosphonate 5-triphosphate synthase subunit PhnG